jgi:hypothetical protein
MWSCRHTHRRRPNDGRTLANYAQFERELISERTRETLAYLKGQGVKIGRCAYGWRFTEERDTAGRRIVAKDQAEQAQIAQMLRLYSEGKSLSEIARSLNAGGRRNRRGTPWSSSTVNLVLVAAGAHKRKSMPRAERIAVAGRVAQLHGRGLSYRAICSQLTKEGYHPPRGRAWHAGSVLQLIRAHSGQPTEGALDLARQLRGQGVTLYEIGVRLTLAGYKDGGAWYPDKVARLLARGQQAAPAKKPFQKSRCKTLQQILAS